MDEKECVFDWEANGLNDGFRYPHQIAIIDNDNENICNTYNMRLPHYELPGPIALYKTNTNWKKTKENHPSLYENNTLEIKFTDINGRKSIELKNIKGWETRLKILESNKNG